MGFKRALRAAGGGAVMGALIFGSSSAAMADQVRNDQWALKAFDTEAIWKISKGKGVIVAVIDDGVDAQHIDLRGNIIEGKDFEDGSSTAPENGEDHGTAMASIIAGHGHGVGASEGAIGLAPEAKILSIRDDGSHLGPAIRYAVDHGASVINVSLEGDFSNPGEEDAVAYALKKNVLVVAGAGNDGGAVGYPAKYPGVVAVGAVDNAEHIWTSSNYGSQILLTAPGTHIVTAGGGTNSFPYSAGSGTSNSTAFVSAAAALLRARYPDLTAGQIANRLVKTTGLPKSEQGISLPDEHYGYGVIQPLAALTRNIPAGPKYGPLSVPESLKPGNDMATSAADDGSAPSNNTLKRAVLFAILGLLGLLIVGAVVFVIARIARRRNGAASRPGGYVAGQPPYGQPPYQQPPHENHYQAGHPSPTHPQQQPPSWNNQ